MCKSALRRHKRTPRDGIPLSGLKDTLAERGEEVQQEQERRAEEKAREGRIGESGEKGLSAKQRKKALDEAPRRGLEGSALILSQLFVSMVSLR